MAIRINETVSKSVLEDALEYYRDNSFGYDGIEDYVNTDFPHYPESKRKEVINYIKKNI